MTEHFEYIHWRLRGKAIRGSIHRAGEGSAPWVIFAHGFTAQRMGPGYLFVTLSRRLAAQGVCSLRFDFAGAGESDGRFADMTVASMKADLLAAVQLVKQRFAPSHVLLLGHSLGGCVAALCAVAARAAGLILLAPVADPMGLVNRRRDTMMNVGLNGNGCYENGPHEIGRPFVEDLSRHDPLAALDGFTGPLLVLQGDSDPSISAAESGRYVQWARQHGLDEHYHLIAGSDHNFSTVPGVESVCATVCAWAKERFQ